MLVECFDFTSLDVNVYIHLLLYQGDRIIMSNKKTYSFFIAFV